MFGELQLLAETVVLFLLFVFVSTNLAVLVLRKDKVDHDHFTIPSSIPVLALISCIVLLIQQTAAVWALGGILLVVGVILYFISHRVKSREKTATEQILKSGPDTTDGI